MSKCIPQVVIVYTPVYDEYRVPGPNGTEAQAYYTNDKDDAEATARSAFKRAGFPEILIKHRRSNK